ncbi:hypothetical protein C4D60_Mb04t21640 [Musa balbisiana]|uniref:Uncharacterized protein n=1 Tax=Musa balbisiana TaxID=52838 RepID=A0A4S8KDP4_MUSBA|nr:hypothetical protein C4D60_Mb04t21640 [Musa balbisiana]
MAALAVGSSGSLLLILEPPLADNGILNPLPVTVLLLKCDILPVELLRPPLGHVVKGKAVDASGSLSLLAPLLELGKGNEELLSLLIIGEEVDSTLINGTGTGDLTALGLELGILDERGGAGVVGDKSFIDGTCPVDLIVPQLELDVGEPALGVRVPVHPAFEYLAGAGDVAEHLFHVDLVDAGEKRNGAVPDVASMVDEAVAHLELRILEPQGGVAVVDLKDALPDGAGAGEVALGLLPGGVLDPSASVPAGAADKVLELLALAEAVVGELVDVGDLLLGRADLGLLPLPGLPQDLLGSDLDGRRGLVLHAGRPRQLHLRVPLRQEPQVRVRRHVEEPCAATMGIRFQKIRGGGGGGRRNRKDRELGFEVVRDGGEGTGRPSTQRKEVVAVL